MFTTTFINSKNLLLNNIMVKKEGGRPEVVSKVLLLFLVSVLLLVMETVEAVAVDTCPDGVYSCVIIYVGNDFSSTSKVLTTDTPDVNAGASFGSLDWGRSISSFKIIGRIQYNTTIHSFRTGCYWTSC